MLTPEQIVEAGLAASRTDGCVVVVLSTSQANVRWANNTVTTSGVATSVDFYAVAVTGGAASAVSGSAADATSAAGVAAVVRAAEDAARAAAEGGPARDAMPLVQPGPGGGSGGSGGSDDFADAPISTSFDVYAGLLDGLGSAFDDARSGGRILYGFARHEMTTVHLGTSTGMRRRWVQPTGTMELNAKSADLRRSSWAGLSTVDFTDIDVLAMNAVLTERLGWARRRVDLPPGLYDTVLPPTAVADFMVYLAWSAGARAAHEGRSAFAAGSQTGGGTRIGERLTERPLTLYADPTEAGLECAPFVQTPHPSDEVSVFDNGAPAGRIDLVRDGTISQLIHTRASAAEYGEPFTPAVDNLILAGGDESRTTADLVADVDRGLLVTSQWYLREVDPMTMLLTGLTRDGVFLIEHGEITAAVNNFRFNVSPLDVLRHGVDVGRTERCLSREWSDWFTRSAMPSIRVEGFRMSSVSKAL
jgi:predicted Zn-dependent protease